MIAAPEVSSLGGMPGRSEDRAKPKTPNPFIDDQKALACIHCGLCLSSCPTYLETGNENHSPRGRIYLMRALQDGRLPIDAETIEPIDLCLGCRACEAVCPSGVEYGHLLEQTRDHIESHFQRSPWQHFLRRIAIEKVFPYPERMEIALAPLKAIRALKLDRFLPQALRDATALVPDSIPQVPLPEFSPAAPPTRTLRAGFVSGCVMPVLFGQTNANTVKLLNQAGLDVVIPRDQVCCGALHAHGGRLETARAFARKNIAAFDRLDLDIIVVNAAGCGSTLKEYQHLLREDSAWADRAHRFNQKVKDITEVFAQYGRPLAPVLANSRRGATVTYHDACHLCHAQGITREPREILKNVAGARFVELSDSDICCGSAGTYNLTEPAMADRLQKRKIDSILKTGAQTVVTTNPGCLLQIQAGLKKANNRDVQALHLVDFLARELS